MSEYSIDFLQTSTFSILLATAFLAGLVDAMAGGGGLITVPALLTAGIPPHFALGTNKLAATFGSLTAAHICIKKGIVKPRLWWLTIFATLVGAIMGTLTTYWVSTDFFKKFLPIIIVFIACYALFYKHSPPSPKNTLLPQSPVSLLLGGILGFYDGFIGPGVGIFWTTAALVVYRVDLVDATGIAKIMNFTSNIVSLVTFMLLSRVNYVLGICLGLAVMVGSYVGLHSILRFGASWIRPVFITIVLVITARLIWLEWLS